MKAQASFEFLAILAIVGFLILSSFYYTSSSIKSFKNISNSFIKNFSVFSYPSNFSYDLAIQNSSTFQKSFAYLQLFSDKPKNISLSVSSSKLLGLSFNNSFELIGSKLFVVPFTPIYPGVFNVSIKINNETITKRISIKQNYRIDVVDLSQGFGNGISVNLILFSKNIFIPIIEISLGNQKLRMENIS
ncbi:MAG: hypothetical protein ACP5HJ_00455, partial [Candidatus Micrarchaeia archaeon]